MERPLWTTGHRAGLAYHRRLIEDPTRMDAYERALRRLVRPGDVVLDLGAGTGILSLLAARCGAARVHAVESMPIARLARELARHNGFADRIVVHEADAATLDPVEPVDLVIGDFMGSWVVDDGMLPAVAAAGRWLKPGGRFCPRHLTLHLAPAGDLVLDDVDTFRGDMYGLDLSPAIGHALQSCYRGDLAPAMLLAPAIRHADLVPPDVDRPLDGTARFTITTPGELRVVAGWFDAELAPEVRLANGPGSATHWGQHLFPLPPTPVETGDELCFELRLLTDRSALAWTWSGRVTRDGRELAAFAQASDGEPLAAPAPPARAAEDVDALNARGVDAFNAGRWADACRAWCRAIAALDPRDDRLPPLHENLGMALAHRGHRSAAVRAFLRALDGDPDSRPQSRRFLDELGHR